MGKAKYDRLRRSTRKGIKKKTPPRTNGLPEAEAPTSRRPEGEGAVAPSAAVGVVRRDIPKPNTCTISTAEITAKAKDCSMSRMVNLTRNATVPRFSKVDEKTTRPICHGQEGMGIRLTRMTLPTAAALVESLFED